MKNLIPFLIILITAISCSSKLGLKTKELTGEEISANFIKQIGGEKTLKRVKTMTMIAVVEMNGMEFQIESYRKAPDKMLVKMKSEQGTITRILNGNKAFVITPKGNLPITGIDLESLIEEATIFPELYREELGQELEYLGIDMVNERKMYKVKLILVNGKERFHFYDIETNLLVKVIDELKAETYYEEYLEIDGVKLPHTNKMVSPTGTLNFRIKEILVNPMIEDKMFEVN